MSNLVLMLGTNIGERQENLKLAVEKLTSYFGKTKIISSIYETEPWGYDDEHYYYNQAVVFSTDFSPREILHICKTIEIQMGRRKNKGETYENRIIDIDILFYDDVIFEDEWLQIPHKQIVDRRFVLEPLNEIIPDYIHPVYNKKINELFLANKDNLNVGIADLSKKNDFDGNIKRSETLYYNYIAIEGCIGAGKTSLSEKISEQFGAKLVLEQFDDNPFLPKFYENMDKYAFPLELSFLAARYRQLNDQLMGIDLFHSNVVADYFLSKSFIFASQNLPDDLFKLYANMFNIMRSKTPEPDLIVYLYLDVENLLSNIKRRGRTYEQSIEAKYLENIQKSYFEFFKQEQNRRILIVNTNNIDFVNNDDDFQKILNEINRKRDLGISEVCI